MKRKMMKRLAALAAALVMAVAVLPAGALAASAPLIDPTALGSITIHKYSMGTLPTTDDGHDGTELAAGDLPAGASALSGIDFRVVQVKDTVLDSDITGLTAATVDAWLTTYGEGSYDKTGTTDSTGVLRFGGSGVVASGTGHYGTLPQGVYLVVELANPMVSTPATPFLVRIPTTANDGESFIYDVHAYPKNTLGSSIEIYKTVTTETALQDTRGIDTGVHGAATTWIIQPEIPYGIDNLYTAYSVYDKLSPKLVFTPETSSGAGDQGNVSAYYYDATAPAVKVPLTKTTHYTYSVNTSTKELNFVLTDAGRLEVAKALPVSVPVNLPRLFITYDTMFDMATADFDDNYTDIGDQAFLTYEYPNRPTRAPWPVPSNIPTVHFGGLDIVKIDGESGNELEGAQFVVYDNETDANSGDLSKALTDPYYIQPTPTDPPSQPWVLTSDEDGKVPLWGLPYGPTHNSDTNAKDDDVTEGSTEYWLVEIKAPFIDQTIYGSGYDPDDEPEDERRYNLLGAPEKITVEYPADDAVTPHGDVVEIENNSGFELPRTGGMGTMLFTLVGLGLICVAVVIFAVSRRRGNARQ